MNERQIVNYPPLLPCPNELETSAIQPLTGGKEFCGRNENGRKKKKKKKKEMDKLEE